MRDLYQLSVVVNQFLVFTVVLTRVSGLVMTAPLFSGQFIPARIRAFMAIALSVVVTLAYGNQTLAVPDNLIEFGLMMFSELMVGATLGFGIAILFVGLQVAGQVISTLSGMSIADVFNPASDSNEP